MIDWQIEETLTMFPRRLLSVVLTFRGKNSTNGIHRFSYLWKQFFEFDSFIWTIYLNHYFESFIWIIYLSYLFYSFIWIKPLPFLAQTKTKKFLYSTFCKQKWHVWGKNLKGSDRQHGWFDPLYCPYGRVRHVLARPLPWLTQF